MDRAEPLKALIASELAQPVDARVAAMAAALAAEYPGAARAVLFYGSCLRQRELDGLMLDFYLIVSSYRDAYRSTWLTIANEAVPPNVFPFGHDNLTAKYAVLSESDFHRLTDRFASTVSVWARFAQPSRLVWFADEAARAAVTRAVAQAAPTLLIGAAAIAAETRDSIEPLELWRLGFQLTYNAELRAERKNRAGSIVDIEPDRYRRFTGPALRSSHLDIRLRGGTVDLTIVDWRDFERERQLWPGRRWKGKLLTLIRLAKATTTFAGGVDYLAWKINRHAGTEIVVRPWQRRWPILGALTLLPRLWMRGAVR